MARKVLNRRELRDANDAAERLGKDETAAEPKTKEKKPAAPRKPRTKTPKITKLMISWGVFNQSMKCVAKFDYGKRADADKRAEELSTSQKTPHFVQRIKETIEV